MQAGQRLQSSAGIIDSQSVKPALPTSEHGFPAGTKPNRRKRHGLVDTQGLMWPFLLHPPKLQDRDGAPLLLAPLTTWSRRQRLIWADGGYVGSLLDWLA